MDHLVFFDHVVRRDLSDESDAREPLHQRRLVQRDVLVEDGDACHAFAYSGQGPKT
ncbi:hypothetical protein [Halorubrum sp. Ib24]|uniref:hypothetical protein n=1 Tax=Halorubrum sp. Ib24 TaxID=1383850 RepID=UPI001F52DBC3|nr:hypothetical protein [Halorubrum sp. Ib24]